MGRHVIETRVRRIHGSIEHGIYSCNQYIVNRYRLDYYFQKEFMREFDFDSTLVRAEDDKRAAEKAIKKMKKKAGNNGRFKHQRLVRLV